MPAAKKKTSSAKVTVKDLKAKKNPKGGTVGLDVSGKIRLGDGSVHPGAKLAMKHKSF